ncbi:hypothetical protein [Microvirga antarctica]|uniref:hypothetical protein n=1 Tax=Microvirga antarctica TaxID=2819233 RepID=UPI001B30CF7B|nr:hypothetical protein [Microvirga antarctica]
MFHLPAAVTGMIGSAFMVASFAPGAISDDVGRDAVGTSSIAVSRGVESFAKADRLAPASPAGSRHGVSVVELVGVSNVRVVLKDDNGNVLFSSDPKSNTTYYSKDTDLPVLTLKEEPASLVKRQPVSRGASEDDAAPKRRAQPHGCLGSVSPLAQAGKESGPSLCVTHLDRAIPTRA